MPKMRRGVRALLLSVLVAPLATVAIARPAQAAMQFPYKILNAGQNQKCFDVATQNNATLQLWKCNFVREQNWDIQSVDDLAAPGFPNLTFVNERSGRCITPNVNDQIGRAVLALPCVPDSPLQQWKIIFKFLPQGGETHPYWASYLVIKNNYSGLCLSIRNNSIQDGTIIQQRVCDTSEPSQHLVING
jgi:hypothetical protein